MLTGQAAYNQYGTPYPGETSVPSRYLPVPEVNPNSPVTYASGLRGSFALAKIAWAHTSSHALSRIQVYRSQYGSSAGGPFWDDLSYP